MKKFIFTLLIVSILFFTIGCNKKEIIHHKDWENVVKKSLNDLIYYYGGKDKNNYVVFDFDNTCSIFDIEEQLKIYQIETMAFNIKPNDIIRVLSKDLTELDKDLSYLGYGKGSYNDWLYDISFAYKKLYDKFGPFDGNELNEDKRCDIINNDYWKEFATKIRILYSIVYDKQSADVAYPWSSYWFYGMNSEQVYNLAKNSHLKYKSIDTNIIKWKSPSSIKSKVGQVDIDVICGVNVSENIIELMNALNNSGIDVWICSASFIDVVKAGVDVWELHDYVKGVMAMTIKSENGTFINEYDYEKGFFEYPIENGGWLKGEKSTKAQTQSKGKVTAIQNVLVPFYNKGPIAGFMDSSGDFNFCTEFKNLKLVVCFNRATRKVTDGGGLISEIAMYQKDIIGKNLLETNSNGDTLYVLQGRDENLKRKLRNSCKSIRYGETVDRLFANEENEEELKYIIDNKLSIREAIHKFSIKTKKENSLLGFEYGFLDAYDGYHSK